MGESINARAQGAPRLRTRPKAAGFLIAGGLIALALSFIVAISLGAQTIKFQTVWEGLFRFDADNASHLIIREIRLPRVILGGLAGAAFAASGAIMQGITRNPLADPGLLGINAGAGFALTAVYAFQSGMPFYRIVPFSLLGAAVGAVLVFGIGASSRGGLSPVRLVLAGAAVTAFLSSLSEWISLRYKVGQNIASWYNGGVAGATWEQLQYIWPFVAVGLVGAILISTPITMLSLGDEVAAGLGIRTGLFKIIGMALVLLLAGTSVAAAGSITFIGLVVPHIARSLVGVHYRWIIPCSAIIGSLLLVVSDTIARIINRPYETSVAVVIAIIGVPFFIYLIRRSKKEVA
ncbi:iron ABC transporter permease [Cohnella sp. AR92]|uniref:FecCD family ABC transporter permease n=1 Tax=Cohnella sp. AR92 TaxID=648716 RepID=UPI000F8F14B0|nr:iron ABC transporter permease [Cohnella sp. AR92]RUS48085.1 iron ABC transporter permease [Cohnella sp. AR92]